MPMLPAEDRLRMVELAMADNPHFEASCIGSGPRRHDLHGGHTWRNFTIPFRMSVSLFFIVGEDILEKFHLWKDPERILRLCTLAVVTRKGAGSPEAGQWDSTLGCDNRSVVRLDSPVIEVSATDIRSRIHVERSPLRYLVPKPVAHYILRRGLYGMH